MEERYCPTCGRVGESEYRDMGHGTPEPRCKGCGSFPTFESKEQYDQWTAKVRDIRKNKKEKGVEYG